MAAAIEAGSTQTAEPGSYPTRPVQLVVPFAAGGATDQLSRILGQSVGRTWNQTIVVDNRAGATGAIASEFVIRQPANGYTLLMATGSSHTVLPAFRKDLPFDTIKDFAAVTLLQVFPNMLVVNPRKIPAKTVKELIQYLKENPGKVSFASTGAGGSSHFAGELFKLITGTNMVHVPYRGSGPAMTDLLAGNVDMIIDNLPTVWPQVQQGSLRAIGVASPRATKLAPGVPAIAETVPGFEAQSWNGLVVRAGTSPDIVEKLARDFNNAARDPDTVRQLTESGSEAVGTSPQEFAQFMKADREKWERVGRQIAESAVPR